MDLKVIIPLIGYLMDMETDIMRAPALGYPWQWEGNITIDMSYIT